MKETEQKLNRPVDRRVVLKIALGAVGALAINACNEPLVETKTGRMYLSQLYTRLTDCGYKGPKSSAQPAIVAAVRYFNDNLDSCFK